MDNLRFKFRVWCRTLKQFQYFQFDSKEGSSLPHSNWYNEKEPIQQCTGIKDRNGKLIYEGDLLGTDLKRPYNIVVFRNGMFMLECEDTNGIYYDLFCGVCDDLKKDIDSCNYEIIGNIYENKDLLEGK